MSAPPVPYRAESNSQQYTPSFPPPVYYRDTFGLEPVEYLQGDCITDSDDESGTTKSTGYFSHLITNFGVFKFVTTILSVFSIRGLLLLVKL